jgi:hypothetical protein
MIREQRRTQSLRRAGSLGLPHVLDRDAAIDSIAAFAEVVGDMDGVSITITSDFENQVRAHLDPKWANVFNQDRGPYGRCMAKTIKKDDGSQVVLFDVHLFLKELPSPERTFRHEALHALINRRGESVFDARDTLSDHADIHPDLVALAGIAADEYRVDRSLNQTSEDPWQSFGTLCVAAHNAIHVASVSYFYNHDTGAIMDAVMRAFSPMTGQAAYIAAWIDAHNRSAPHPGGRRAPRTDAWQAVEGGARRVPEAPAGGHRDDSRTDRANCHRDRAPV